MKFALALLTKFSYRDAVFSGNVNLFKAFKRVAVSGLHALVAFSLLSPMVFCVHANGNVALEVPHVQHDSSRHALDSHSHGSYASEIQAHAHTCHDKDAGCHDSRVVAENAVSFSLKAPQVQGTLIFPPSTTPSRALFSFDSIRGLHTPTSLNHLRTIVLLI